VGSVCIFARSSAIVVCLVHTIAPARSDMTIAVDRFDEQMKLFWKLDIGLSRSTNYLLRYQ
jgi:hypothetical protein